MARDEGGGWQTGSSPMHGFSSCKLTLVDPLQRNSATYLADTLHL